jgi:hypothetical protein
LTIAGFKKAELFDLCQATHKLGFEIDPDGICEDREEILKVKLTIQYDSIL